MEDPEEMDCSSNQEETMPTVDDAHFSEPATESEVTKSTHLQLEQPSCGDNSASNQMLTCTQCSKLYMINTQIQNSSSDKLCSFCHDSQTSDNKSAVSVMSLIYSTSESLSQDTLDIKESIDEVNSEVDRCENVLLEEIDIKEEEEVLEKFYEEEEEASSIVSDVVMREADVVVNTENEIVNTENKIVNTENEIVNTENVTVNTENVVVNTENEIVSDDENSVLDLQVYDPDDCNNLNVDNNQESPVDSTPQENSEYDNESSIPRKKTEIIYEYNIPKIEDPIPIYQKSIRYHLQWKGGLYQFNVPKKYIHCANCKKDFLNLDYYETHIKIHSPKCSRCALCSKNVEYMDFAQFLAHFKSHVSWTTSKGKKCPFCDKLMFMPKNCIMHMKIMHPTLDEIENKNEDDPQSMEVVPQPQPLEDPTVMIDNIKTYLFELPYDTLIPCSQCSKEIQVDKFIDEHLPKCKNNEKLSCHLCSKHEHQDTYALALSQVYQHFMDLRHIFKCNLCNNSFLTFENHRTHMQHTHNDEFVSKGKMLHATAIKVLSFNNKNERQEVEEDIEDTLSHLETTPSLSKTFNHIEKKMVKVRFDIRFNSCPCFIHCHACKKDIDRKDFFDTHITKLPIPKDHSNCVFCGNDISKLTDYQYVKHTNCHFVVRNSKTFKCKTCNIAFFTDYNRSLHMKDAHDIEEEAYKKKKLQLEESQAQSSNESNLTISNNDITVRATSKLEEILQYMRKFVVFMANLPIYIVCQSCKVEYFFEDFYNKHLIQCGRKGWYKCFYCKEHSAHKILLKYLEASWDHLTSLKNLLQCQECDHVFLSATNHILHVNNTHTYLPDPDAFLTPVKYKVPSFLDEQQQQQQKPHVIEQNIIKRSKRRVASRSSKGNKSYASMEIEEEPESEPNTVKRSKRVASLNLRGNISYASMHHGKIYNKKATSTKNKAEISENTEGVAADDTASSNTVQISGTTEAVADVAASSSATQHRKKATSTKNKTQISGNTEGVAADDTASSNTVQISGNTGAVADVAASSTATQHRKKATSTKNKTQISGNTEGVAADDTVSDYTAQISGNTEAVAADAAQISENTRAVTDDAVSSITTKSENTGAVSGYAASSYVTQISGNKVAATSNSRRKQSFSILRVDTLIKNENSERSKTLKNLGEMSAIDTASSSSGCEQTGTAGTVDNSENLESISVSTGNNNQSCAYSTSISTIFNEHVVVHRIDPVEPNSQLSDETDESNNIGINAGETSENLPLESYVIKDEINLENVKHEQN